MLECQTNTENKCESFWKHLLKYPGHNLIQGLKCLEYDKNINPTEALGNTSWPQEILYEILEMNILQIDIMFILKLSSISCNMLSFQVIEMIKLKSKTNKELL